MVVKMSEKLFVVERHSAKRWQKRKKKKKKFSIYAKKL